MTRRILTIVVLLVVLPFAPALAEPHPDLSGTWVVELAASDSPDELLKMLGKSAVERAIARKMRPTHRIVQDEGGITLTVESPIDTRTERLHLDGREVESRSLSGDPVTARHNWSDDGTTIVTQTSATTKEGRALRVTGRRRLIDATTMELVWELDSEGTHARMRRVLRKE